MRGNVQWTLSKAIKGLCRQNLTALGIKGLRWQNQSTLPSHPAPSKPESRPPFTIKFYFFKDKFPTFDSFKYVHFLIQFRTNRSWLICIFLFFLVEESASLLSQNYLTNVQFYNYENGLAGRYTNCTFRDSRGLIWVGTQFGLNRFDGRDFLTFDETSGLPFNQVMEIHEDSEGWLLLHRTCVGKESCIPNLAFFHTITHEVHSFDEHLGELVNFEAKDIISIYSEEDGTIFLSARGQVIQWKNGAIIRKIDLSDIESTPFLMAKIDTNQLAGWIHSEDENGNAFFDWLVFDFEGNLHHHQHIPNYNKRRPINSVLSMGTDYLGRQIIGFEHYVKTDEPYLILQENGELLKDTSIWVTFENPKSLLFNPFRPILWKQVIGDLLVYTPNKELVYRFGDEYKEFTKSLYNRQIRFEDDDITWMAGRYGVFRIQLKRNLFERVLFDHLPEVESRSKDICKGIAPLGKHKLLLSTNLDFYEKTLNTDDAPIPHEEFKNFFPIALTKGYQDKIWGIAHNKFYQIELRTNDFPLIERTNIENRKFDQTYSLFYQNDRLWIGTDKGLVFYDHFKNEFFEWTDYGQFEALKESFVNQIYKESENRLWLATSSGLYLFSPEVGIKERYWNGGTGKNHIPALYIYQIQPAGKGGWWLATQQGLVYWNPSNNESKIFTAKDGLAANEILALHEDEYGFLWLATNAGLIQFQISSEFSKVWLKEEGITSRDFEPYTYYCQEDGKVWFGTTNGYTVFHPKDFKDIDFTSKPDIPLNILNFEQISSETKKLEDQTQYIIQNQQIILKPGEQLFNLRVALADYVNGEEAQYAYRIKGAQDFWQEGKENLIRISGLPYGQFNLEVKGKLANGQYSSNEIHLPIYVLKPFYLKTWFFFIVGMTLFLTFFLWYKWRTNQLKKQQIILEGLVKERTATIQQQAEDLKSLERLKSRFFANVSHELRTPLTLMLGPVNSLIKRSKENETNLKLLQYVERNGRQLMKLINEILDLSKLEDNKLEVVQEPVLFFDYLRDQTAQFHSFGTSERVHFEVDFSADAAMVILLDRSKFEKIIHNFLSNALKFTPQDGTVQLTVKEKAETLLIKVKDTGKGIHPDDLPHIFDRFYQAKKATGLEKGGTGIGLSLCKELAQLLGGKVWAESELGKGSIFYFEFPKQLSTLSPVKSIEPASDQQDLDFTANLGIDSEQKENTILATKATIDDHKIGTILVVEDNKDLREYLKFLLAEYRVLTAENGKVALEILHSQIPIQISNADTNPQPTTHNPQPSTPHPAPRTPHPDLIISDLMMPVMDGFEFLERLKSENQWRHIPVIMLTAKVNVKAKLKALRIGVDDYLTKPFEEEELIVRIENLLKNSSERLAALQDWSYADKKEELFQDSNQRKNNAADPIWIMTVEDQEWLQQLEKIVIENMHRFEFNVDTLYPELAMSRSNFYRRLKILTGLSPSQYINENRFNHARQLLESGAVNSIKSLAYDVGLKDKAHFSRQFKKRFGKLPSEYLSS